MLICLSTGSLLLISGLVIWKRNVAELISGIDLARITDRRGLTCWVGRSLSIMGALCVMIGGAVLLYPRLIELLGAVFGVTVLGISLLIMLGARRYQAPRL